MVSASPIWVADYVMIGYGSGAIMAVPAHDERDFAFARQYGLQIRPVIPAGRRAPQWRDDGSGLGRRRPDWSIAGHFDGAEVTRAKGRANPGIAAVIDWLAETGIGEESVNYRLRDWLISRQRYWGCPIPIIHRQDDDLEVVPDEELPVLLPEGVEFMPTGRSPLTYHEPFLTHQKRGWRARAPRDRYDGYLPLLIVVSISLPQPAFWRRPL